MRSSSTTCCLLAIHRGRNPIGDLIGECSRRIGGPLYVSPAHGDRLMPEQVAHQECVGAGLSSEGACGMSEVVRPELGEPVAAQKAASPF